MFTRREIVSHGAIGAIAASATSTGAAAEAVPQDNKDVVDALKRLQNAVEGPLQAAFESNSLNQGYVGTLRTAFTSFLRTNNKWPDYCEVGMRVFYDIYDWHVKHQLVPEVVRVLDNRMAIKFMFTYLIVRTDQESQIGVPYDKITG